MTKPSDYPPVEEMGIKAVRDLLLRLELEKAQKQVEEIEGQKERIRQAVDDSILPNELLNKKHRTQTFLLNEQMPQKQWQIAEGTWDVGVTEDDMKMLMVEAWIPFIGIWLLVALIALFDV